MTHAAFTERYSPGAKAMFQLPYDRDEADLVAGAPTTVYCAFCDFSFSGAASDATLSGRQHALKVHGLVAKKRRR